jgi:hypothetical protein
MIRDKLYIENRIAKLNMKPTENANLIKKWKRKLRALGN